MTYIKSRKHASPSATSPVNSKLSAAVAGALLLPLSVHAQQAQNQQVAQSQLPAVEINATQDPPYKADSVSSPKYSQPLVDTPQTMVVIKRQLADEQGATTLTEALRNTPGVGTFYLGENGTTSTGDAIYMRGFDASSAIFVDSVRDLGSISRDMFNISQIEVLKGPAGTDNGRGAPTGSINLVTKQAELNEFYNGTVTFGSANQKRTTADLNKVINESSGTALRLNLMAQDSGVPGRDVVNNKRYGFAPSLAIGLNSPTHIFLNYQHIEQDNVPDGGVSTIGLPGYTSPDPARPYLANAARVDSSNFYGLKSDYDRVSSDMLTARIEHDFAPNLKLQNTTRYGRTRENYMLTSYMATAANLVTPSATNPSTWTVARSNPTGKAQTNEILTNQTYLTSELATGSIRHTLVSGFELTEEKQKALSFTRAGTVLTVANLYNPNSAIDPPPGYRYDVTGNNEGKTDTVSAYVFDTMKFNDRWSLNGGVRLDRYKTDYYAIAAGVVTDLHKSGTLFNWKLAAIYKPTANSSIYALYATSQQPPGGANFALSATASSAANSAYDPQETKTTEIGTKWDLLDKKLAATAAVYKTVVTNEVEQDPTSLLYYQTGKKSVQGIELGLVGNVTSNWMVSTGYTYMDTKVDSGKTVTNNGDNVLAYTPKQAFTSWTTYKLPFGVTVGGGARYVSRLLRGTDGAIGTPAYADAYWVFDGMASYKVNKNLTLQMNVYNLFNKEYVAAINKSGYRYTPGAPRSVSVTAYVYF